MMIAAFWALYADAL